VFDGVINVLGDGLGHIIDTGSSVVSMVSGGGVKPNAIASGLKTGLNTVTNTVTNTVSGAIKTGTELVGGLVGSLGGRSGRKDSDE